ncbi:hypothetical protein OC845_005487, partial [Tilletia horrida]
DGRDRIHVDKALRTRLFPEPDRIQQRLSPGTRLRVLQPCMANTQLRPQRSVCARERTRAPLGAVLPLPLGRAHGRLWHARVPIRAPAQRRARPLLDPIRLGCMGDICAHGRRDAGDGLGLCKHSRVSAEPCGCEQVEAARCGAERGSAGYVWGRGRADVGSGLLCGSMLCARTRDQLHQGRACL